jgi:hypothetical protein
MESSSPRRSSRPRRTVGAAAVVAVGLVLAAATAAAAFARRDRAPKPDGLRLALEVRIDAKTARPPGRAGGVLLALNAMSDGDRSRMADVLDEVADNLERRHNPLVEDLDDQADDAQSAVRDLARARLPMITAALALAPGRWTSADGGMVVRATTSCAPDARCIPLAGDEASAHDPVATRARFLAWPLAYGIVVRPPPEKAGAVVDALRTSVEGSRIALVLGRDDVQSLRFSAALPRLADGAARIDRWGPDEMPLRDLFRKLSSGDPIGDELRWLVLPRGGLLVVPRLGALATIAAFVQEVQRRVGEVASERVEWLSLPPT